MSIDSLVSDLPDRRGSRSLPLAHSFLDSNWLPIAVYVALVTSFWWPSLAHGFLILHGDAAHHGLSLLTLLSRWLHGGDSLLWSTGIYGGHPLFAESQGGFLNPVNITGALFEPNYGFGIVHWLDMLLSGLGVYFLCRSLGINGWAALFAAVSVSYSSVWLGFQYNISVAGALAWMPWLFLAVQYWLKSPSILRSLWMPLPASLLIFAGYPHIAHGAAIYLMAYGMALVLQKEGREFIFSSWRGLLLGGGVALVIALLLSAVQLVSLFELVKESHRSGGTPLPLAGIVSFSSYMAGFFFFDWQVKPEIITVGSLSSWAVGALALLVFFLRAPFRVRAHALPAFILFNLGIEFASPIFKLVYEYNLIPGLHNYRIMHPFLPLAVMGVCILAAYTLSALSEGTAALRGVAQRIGVRGIATLVCVLVALLSALCFDSSFGFENYIYPTLVCMAVCVLIGSRFSKFIPVAVSAVVLADAVFVRGDVFDFYSPSSIPKSEAIAHIKGDANYAEFRSVVDPDALLFVFYPPNSPNLDAKYGAFLDALSPFPTMVSGVPSMDGALGLSLRRREIVESTILEEIKGSAANVSPLRLIDIFSIKYIARSVPLDLPGLEVMYRGENGLVLYRNTHALPMLRAYAHAESVGTAEQALEKLKSSTVDTLYVEVSGRKGLPGGSCAVEAPKPAKHEWVKRSQAAHVVTVESDCSGWLYLGDAYFPGWKAIVNGRDTEVYPANVLGKAVHFPAGRSRIEIIYAPRSFLVGLMLSSIGVMIWCFVAWVSWGRRHE